MNNSEDLPWGDGPGQRIYRLMWVWSKCYDGATEGNQNNPLWWDNWTGFCTHSWHVLNNKIRNKGWL